MATRHFSLISECLLPEISCINIVLAHVGVNRSGRSYLDWVWFKKE